MFARNCTYMWRWNSKSTKRTMWWCKWRWIWQDVIVSVMSMLVVQQYSIRLILWSHTNEDIPTILQIQVWRLSATPTTGTWYTYQRSVSWIDLSNVNSMQISWSSTGTEIQVYVDTNTTPASFTWLIELEIGNGVITWYINGTLVCNGSNCKYLSDSINYNAWHRITTQWDYNTTFVMQTFATDIPILCQMFSYKVNHHLCL